MSQLVAVSTSWRGSSESTLAQAAVRADGAVREAWEAS